MGKCQCQAAGEMCRRSFSDRDRARYPFRSLLSALTTPQGKRVGGSAMGRVGVRFLIVIVCSAHWPFRLVPREERPL
jgi:hypothetical protein